MDDIQRTLGTRRTRGDSEGASTLAAKARGMTTVTVVVSILVLAIAAWIAGEQHYQGCVESAVAVTENIRPRPSVDAQMDGAALPNNRARINA
jgi:hypothetical protein